MSFRILAAALTSVSALIGAEIKYEPINPALLYWQASALLPKITEEGSKILRETAAGRRTVDLGQTSVLIPESAELLLNKAAKSTAPCQWGLLLEDGPHMPMPHLAMMQDISQRATVKAEAAFTNGKAEEALDWLLLAHRVARHVGSGDNLMSFLVQTSIETSTLRAAARHCLSLDEPTRHRHLAWLKELPPLHRLQDSVRGELVHVDWIERHFKSGTPAQLQELIKALDPAQADKPKQPQPYDSKSVEKAIAELRVLYQKTQGALGNPWSQVQPQMESLAAEARSSASQLVKETYPVMTALPAKEFTITTLRTMLEAVLQHGSEMDEATAAAYHDAFEGKPLRFIKNDDGTFTLQCAEPHPKGKIIELKLGK